MHRHQGDGKLQCVTVNVYGVTKQFMGQKGVHLTVHCGSFPGSSAQIAKV
jgi:hypothetical protein